MSDTTIEIPLGSVEYLYADLEGDILLDGTVEMALGGAPNDVTWESADWVGDVGMTRSARVLLDGTLAQGTYYLWARVTDTPEVPIIKCGKVKIVVR